MALTYQKVEEYAQPTTTSNQLGDIFNWLQNGNIVVLKSKFAQYIFHNCEINNEKPLYIFVDVNAFPSLLNEGEWPDFLTDAGTHVCLCPDIINKLNNAIKSNAPNVFKFVVPKLGSN